MTTIVALATPRGKAAIAIIRLSGPRTRFVLETVAGTVPAARQATLRPLGKDQNSKPIDKGLVLWFPAPHSYTGEDSAELHVHGSTAILQALLAQILSCPGLKLAEPGEFTKRAVLNGKLDLAAAEAVTDLISAETELQRQQALRQLEGGLSRACALWQSRLVSALAHVESSLDFSDEADVPTDVAENAQRVCSEIAHEIAAALEQSRYGERVREGFRIAILGAPNAGKSSLLNCLSGRDVAIVTPLPGTTRDSLEVIYDLDGMPVIFIDTAGLRESQDPIELMGMDRSRWHAQNADLVLWLMEPNGPEPDLPVPNTSLLTVGTKSDLALPYRRTPDVTISVTRNDGLDRLLRAIMAKLNGGVRGDALVTRQRHRDALHDAHMCLLRALDCQSIDELYAEEIRLAIRSIGRVVGTVDLDRVLDRVFSEFCIGK